MGAKTEKLPCFISSVIIYFVYMLRLLIYSGWLNGHHEHFHSFFSHVTCVCRHLIYLWVYFSLFWFTWKWRMLHFIDKPWSFLNPLIPLSLFFWLTGTHVFLKINLWTCTIAMNYMVVWLYSCVFIYRVLLIL